MIGLADAMRRAHMTRRQVRYLESTERLGLVLRVDGRMRFNDAQVVLLERIARFHTVSRSLNEAVQLAAEVGGARRITSDARIAEIAARVLADLRTCTVITEELLSLQARPSGA